MSIVELLGFIAATLTTMAFLPQVIKVYKDNQTSDLSILTFVMFNIGLFCWIIYGLLIKIYPLIIANICTFLLSSYILYKIVINIKNKNI